MTANASSETVDPAEVAAAIAANPALAGQIVLGKLVVKGDVR